MLTGKSLINGAWMDTSSHFQAVEAVTANKLPTLHTVSGPDEVARAGQAASDAFLDYAGLDDRSRAKFLDVCADEIDNIGAQITEIGALETGLPVGRLDGERGRTVGQLRLFAQYIREGRHHERRVDVALPDRQPLPRPDLRLMMRPIGPVAVFGASNFPLAFSVAGGDPETCCWA